jgi:hypothetical protein
VLTHALRQASVSLIFDVRSIRAISMKRHRQTNRYRTQADDTWLAVPPRIFSSYRIGQLGLATCLYFPREQIRRPDPRPTKQSGAVIGPKGFLRISRFGRGVYAQSARSTAESTMITRSPNKAMVPTPVSVTILADARIAPLTSAAHLHR